MIAAVLALAVLAMARTAAATTGGPDLAELLGWSPADQRAYFAIHHSDESGDSAAVYYMDLRALRPGRLVRVDWSRIRPGRGDERRRADSTYQARWTSLVRRLVKLPLEVAPTIPLQTTIVKLESLENPSGPWARFRVRISDADLLWGNVVEVTTVRDPSVSMSRIFAIPGRRARLAILSFIGIPDEMGYEAQVPILIQAGSDTIRVESRRDYD